MNYNKYNERIMSLPVSELHTLVEENPKAAIEWAEHEEYLANSYAEKHGIVIDENAMDELLNRLMRWISENRP